MLDIGEDVPGKNEQGSEDEGAGGKLGAEKTRRDGGAQHGVWADHIGRIDLRGEEREGCQEGEGGTEVRRGGDCGDKQVENRPGEGRGHCSHDALAKPDRGEGRHPAQDEGCQTASCAESCYDGNDYRIRAMVKDDACEGERRSRDEKR